MHKQTYQEIAEVIQTVRRKYLNAGAAIAEIERELTVRFLNADPGFSASLFLSWCKLPDEEIAARAAKEDHP